MRYAVVLLMIVNFVFLSGCQTAIESLDNENYSLFRESSPKTILVLPPINNTNSAGASYTFLSTITLPLANKGYYVFPVAVVDRSLRENGLTHPEVMHEAPLEKLVEYIGADAVLYVEIKHWGSMFALIGSGPVVHSSARLVDAHTGDLLWRSRIFGTLDDEEYPASDDENSEYSSSFTKMILGALVDHIVSGDIDHTPAISSRANYDVVHHPFTGWLPGPYENKEVINDE